jgi:imidazolonepropionase-like amidohydrolase
VKNILAVLALLYLSEHTTLAAPLSADLILRHAIIVDVEHSTLVADQAVVIRGDTLMDVGADASLATKWRTPSSIDAAGRYLIPGLWDMHVHFGGGPELIEENKALMPLYIAHGITTVRDCSGDLPQEVLKWRGELAQKSLLGPQLFTSGAKLEGIHPVWKGTLEVGSQGDVDAALSRLTRDRVDFVKITDSTIDPNLFLYALTRVHGMGMRASGHIPLQLTVQQAVDSGISSIEHIDYAYQAGVKDEASIAADFAAGRIDRAEAYRRIDVGFDLPTARAAYTVLAKRGVSVTPTLNGSRITAWLDSDDHAHDAYLAYIGPKLRKTYDWRIERASRASPAEIAFRHQHFEHLASILPLLQQAGVSIMAGTDAGFLNSFDYPGIGLHEELSLFVKSGLTPPQALIAATRAGPAWFGLLDQYGSISNGRVADLLLLDGNPLEDISATRTIRAVVLHGRFFDRPALDKLLKDTRDKVAGWNRETSARQ